jgi:hypothetical protein
MTPKLLDERDPDGEVRGWLEVIAEMAVGSRLTVRGPVCSDGGISKMQVQG